MMGTAHGIPASGPGEPSLQRLARLADFIFAVALLFLLTTVTIAPDGLEDAGARRAYLSAEFGQWAGFVISFILIAFYWISHQQLFSYYVRTDKTHTLLELIFLMCVTIMPFGNHFIGQYYDLYEARLVVSIDLAAVGFMTFLIWSYATKNRRLIGDEPDDETIAALRKATIVMPITALVAAAAAYFWLYLWEICLLIVPTILTLKKMGGKTSAA